MSYKFSYKSFPKQRVPVMFEFGGLTAGSLEFLSRACEVGELVGAMLRGARRVITVHFKNGRKGSYKADRADVQNGLLRLLLYTTDRSRLYVNDGLKADTISWARLDDGTYVIGSDEVAKWN